MNTASYIIVNFLLFFSWHYFLFIKKHYLSCADRLIGTAILSLSQIIVTGTVLGVLFKKLYAGPLFFLNVIISSLVLLVTYTLKENSSCDSYIAEVRNNFTDLFKLLKNDLLLAVIFLLALITVIWISFLGYLFPSYTWDALWYHLPIVGYIMQSGAIQEVPNHSFIHQFINIFPKNTELFFLWNSIFLESDVIMDLSQILFALLGVLSIYSLSVKIGIKKHYSLYGAFLFLFTPILLLQLTTNYVDVAISALFLVAINFLVNNDKIKKNDAFGSDGTDMTRFSIILAGLTTGLLFGSKGSGPIFVVILSVVVIVMDFKNQRVLRSSPAPMRKLALKTLMVYLIYFLIPVILLGGYWYGKNWILYNNPVYPMEISVFNITIFKGLYKGIIEPAPDIINKLSPLARAPYVWSENIKHYLYDSRLGGLGPIWFILFLPSLVFASIISVTEKKFRLSVVVIIILAAFLITPRNWTPRYVIFITGLGALSFSFMMDYFKEKDKFIKTLSVLLAMYSLIISNSPCVTPGQIKKFIDLSPSERTIARHAPFNIDIHARQEYGHWIWISNNVKAKDTMVYTFEPLFLSPLWNSSFSNRIVYLKGDSYNSWLNKLKKENSTYVLVKIKSIEDKWIEASRSLKWLGAKESFDIVYSDKNYKIARFTKG